MKLITLSILILSLSFQIAEARKAKWPKKGKTIKSAPISAPEDPEPLDVIEPNNPNNNDEERTEIYCSGVVVLDSVHSSGPLLFEGFGQTKEAAIKASRAKQVVEGACHEVYLKSKATEIATGYAAGQCYIVRGKTTELFLTDKLDIDCQYHLGRNTPF